MSVGDSETPPGRPPDTEQGKSGGPSSVAASRSARNPAAAPPPDGPIATAMEVLDIVGGARHQNRQSRPVTTLQSPRISSRGGENKGREDHEATRCELERLLSTAGTNDKKQKVKEALDHLEDDSSSGRGTALAIIVNDALAVASAAVVSSKKRHQTFAGHEHIVVRGRGGEAVTPKRRSRFDRDRFELWRPKDRSGVAARTPASEATGVGQADSTSGAGQDSGGETLEPELQPPVASARRFTAHILPSIPEHRVLGRRVLVRETPGGGGKGGDETTRNEGLENKIGDCGIQRSDQKREGGKTANSELVARGGHTTTKLKSSLASPRRKGVVLDVPHGLFGEASSTGVDPSHPPCAAVDGVLASFWLTTGLFPQTLTIRLHRPVAVYEVMVACGGVDAARVHLGHVNGSVRDSSNEEGGGIDVGDGHGRDARATRGGRWKEGSLLELVREQQRPFATGGGAAAEVVSNSDSRSGPSRKTDSSLTLAKMTFRVPGEGRLAEEVDRLSLVVTSARVPFCLVSSVTIRGQFGEDGEEELGGRST